MAGWWSVLRQGLVHAINRYGFENLTGETFLSAMEDLGVIEAGGLYQLNADNGNRAPARTQIRRVELVDGVPTFVAVTDWFDLPDTRPSGAE